MKKLVIALTVLASSSVFAAESAQSEFYHQSTAGQHEGTAGLTYHTGDTDEGTGSEDISGEELFVEYEYGFNDMFALGARIGFQQYKVDSTPSADRNGLQDIEITLRGKHTLGQGLRYGATLAVATEDGEIKANGDRNATSGQTTLTPYVGWEWAMDGHLFGAKLSRDLELAKGTVDNAGTDIDVKHGEATTLAAFYEHAISATWAIGGSLEYAMIDDLDFGTTTMDMGNSTTVKVYAPVALPVGTLIPSIASVTTDGDNNDTSDLALSVKYRMDF